VGSAATQKSARHALQLLEEDLQRALHGIDECDKLQDEYRDLLSRSLDTDENLEYVLKELVAYHNINLPAEEATSAQSHRSSTPSSSPSSDLHPLLQAYHEKA